MDAASGQCGIVFRSGIRIQNSGKGNILPNADFLVAELYFLILGNLKLCCQSDIVVPNSNGYSAREMGLHNIHMSCMM